MSENNPTIEIWKPIPNYEGFYSVSSLGKIRREAAAIGTQPGRILNPVINSAGYPKVILCKSLLKSQRMVHCLVAEAFLGPRPKGKEVNHLDHNKQNPALSNLEYISHRENMEKYRKRKFTSRQLPLQTIQS